MAPPFLGSFERVIAKGAETSIPGLKAPVPVGTRVASSAFVVMRSNEVFGDDAGEFRPERWMTDDGEHKKAMEASWFVFGRGSRGCIGKDLALMLASKVIAEVWSHVYSIE